MIKIICKLIIKTMDAIIVSIAFFATIFGFIYLFYTTRHKERMALIEKGADASLFAKVREGGKFIKMAKMTLKAGMFLMGIGLGIVAGAMLDSFGVMTSGANFTSMIFLFGGLSLVLYYLIERKSKQ
jgi:preprotein translocase subunit YajC